MKRFALFLSLIFAFLLPAQSWAVDIAYRASTQNNHASQTSETTNKPTGTIDGDLVLCFFVINASPDTSSDNNGSTPFTKVYSSVGFNPSTNLTVYRRVANSEPTTYSFNTGIAASRVGLACLTFSNPNTSTIFDITPSASTWSDVGASPDTVVNITTNNDKSIHIIATNPDGASQTFTGPGGYSIAEQVSGTGQCVGVYYKIITPAGAVGTLQVSWSTSVEAGLSQSFAINNNTGGGGGAETFGFLRRRQQ